MTLRSAGLLAFRRRPDGPEFLLGHPGGPFWRSRDLGAWTIPKGLVAAEEDPLAAARREFEEEVGLAAPGPFTPLGERRQRGGKVVSCWLTEADLDLAGFSSGIFEMEWPPRSGRIGRFPELDQVRYMPLLEAGARILPGQRGFLEDALGIIAAKPSASAP